MGGLLSFLSPALTTATQAAGTYQGAQAHAQQQQQQQIIQAVQLKRQQQDEALKQALGLANIGHLAAETHKLNEPDKPHYSPVTAANASGENEVYRFNALTGQMEKTGVSGKAPAPPKDPTPHFSVTPITSADGTVHLARVNSLTGEVIDTGQLGKQPGTGSGGGAQGAQVPVADMKQRFQEIKQHATALGAGTWKITPGMQSREGLEYGVARENASGHPSVTHTVAKGVMGSLGVGGDDYPTYQSLMNSTRALGDDVAKVFKGRQNEESVLREVTLSELTPDDYNNPQVVQQKLDRLQHVINLAELNNPSQAGIGGGAPHAPAHPTTPKKPATPGTHPLVNKYGLEL